MDSVRELLIEQMQDLYDAEKQLVKALPKMAKAASNSELKQAFESHLEETKGHVQRLEQAFELLEAKAKSKPCAAMKGLVEEGEETIKEDLSEPLLDSAIICAAQKVEHYEIAGYGTLISWANSIGLRNVAKVFEETLKEEKEADQKLTQVAGEVLTETGESNGKHATAGGHKGATEKSGSHPTPAHRS
jgi:ferritin-like metal-binding protein YciE